MATTDSVHRCRFDTANDKNPTNGTGLQADLVICDTISLGLEAAVLLRVPSDDDSKRVLAVCGPDVYALGLGEQGELQGTSCVHKGAPICKAVRDGKRKISRIELREKGLLYNLNI